MNALQFSIPTDGEAQQRALFEGYAGAGFDGLQLKGGQYARYLDAPAQFVEQWGQLNGGALICGGALDENGRAELARVFRFGAAVGAAMVVFCHGHPHAGVDDQQRHDFAQILSELGLVARGHGLKLSLHQHTDQPVMTRADVRAFFGAATPGALGLTLDTAHWVKSGQSDFAGTIEEFAGWIDNVHLKDYARGEWQTLGRGDVDFAPIFAALRAINYAGPMCADEESGADVAAGMSEARVFLRAHLEK